MRRNNGQWVDGFIRKILDETKEVVVLYQTAKGGKYLEMCFEQPILVRKKAVERRQSQCLRSIYHFRRVLNKKKNIIFVVPKIVN